MRTERGWGIWQWECSLEPKNPNFINSVSLNVATWYTVIHINSIPSAASNLEWRLKIGIFCCRVSGTLKIPCLLKVWQMAVDCYPVKLHLPAILYTFKSTLTLAFDPILLLVWNWNPPAHDRAWRWNQRRARKLKALSPRKGRKNTTGVRKRGNIYERILTYVIFFPLSYYLRACSVAIEYRNLLILFALFTLFNRWSECLMVIVPCVSYGCFINSIYFIESFLPDYVMIDIIFVLFVFSLGLFWLCVYFLFPFRFCVLYLFLYFFTNFSILLKVQ